MGLCIIRDGLDREISVVDLRVGQVAVVTEMGEYPSAVGSLIARATPEILLCLHRGYYWKRNSGSFGEVVRTWRCRRLRPGERVTFEADAEN